MRLKILILTAFIIIVSFGAVSADTTEVLPEITTKIQLSSSDINRIHCSHGEISDVLFSEEKGIEVKIHGKDAFIKFTVQHGVEGRQHRTTPAEVYFICGEDMYTVIAEPKKIPAVTVNLSSSLRDRINKSRDFFRGLAFEEKSRKLIKHAYTDTLPDYFNVTNVSEDIGIFNEVKLRLIRTVRVEGEGVLLKEFVLRNETSGTLHLQEEDFLIKEITRNASAVSLDPHELRSGEKARLFIVERIKDEGTLLLFSNK